jgi:Zn-finger nucleic acid-binding protein
MHTQPAAALACPSCHTGLVMAERQGIEIDYCPSCRGVWLDRGEVDKSVVRCAIDLAPARQPASQAQPSPLARRSRPPRFARRWPSQAQKALSRGIIRLNRRPGRRVARRGLFG